MILALLFMAFQADPPVPRDLEVWREWVLYGQEEKLCPTLFDDANKKRCAWPSRLRVSVDDNGGSFQQEWSVYAPSWLPLPGDTDYWPLSVGIDGQQVSVLDRNGVPSVYLETGKHTITGRWQWSDMPNTLQVPKATGIVSLQLSGRRVARAKRDESGRLWLQSANREKNQTDRLGLRVFRLIDDGIPTFLETHIQLDVSGKGREVALGKPLPEGFMAHAITSDLPVRLDEDGSLHAQVRPGRWTIRLMARAGDVVEAVTLHDGGPAWPETELWSYRAQRSLRSVTPTGPGSVDPTQTELPAAWHELPGFLVARGDRLELDEKSRGVDVITPESLKVKRTLWLDFSGKGWTFQDVLEGQLRRNWRLSMTEPFQPGRISSQTGDQLITSIDNRAGTELRSQSVYLDVDGRLETNVRVLPVNGWETTLDKVDVTLHLPPGWFLLGAFGPDYVQGDWLNSWHLWDFFWVLLLSLGAGKLWGRSRGILALVTLVLLHEIPDLPHTLWMGPLIVVALLRVLPQGKLQRTAVWLGRLVLLILVVNVAPFTLQQIQNVLYPQLSMKVKKSHNIFSGGFSKMSDTGPNMAPQKRMMLEEVMEEEFETRSQQYLNFMREDAVESKVQTGQGIPRWSGFNQMLPYSGETAGLYWSGPIDSTQTVRLLILPPFLNNLLSLVRIVLVLLLVMVVAEIKLPRFKPGKATPLLLLPLLLCLVPSRAGAQSTPPQELLNELRDRLLQPADCYPHCATIQSANLEVGGDRLDIDLDVHSAEDVAIPLPGRPAGVIRNNQSMPLTLDAEGVLWTLTSKGRNRIRLTYNLSGMDTVALIFPIKPHRGSWRGTGWTMDGIHRGGAMEAQVELRREQSGNNQIREVTEGGLTPFARVTRIITLHHKWTVQTLVRNNNQAPLVTQIPLLPGETVITNGIRVTDNKVAVNLPGDTDAVLAWESTLPASPQITLRSPEQASWTETWELIASHRWHVVWQGTPTIRYFSSDGSWLPSWQPRANEELVLDVERPAPLGGQTLTIDRAQMKVKPGRRATDFELDLELRTSLGGEHGVGLPENVQLESLTVDGEAQSIRLEDGKVMIPLQPGQHSVGIRWQDKAGLSWLYRTPQVDLGHQAVNIHTHISMPGGRWLLWTSGPTLGPAVAFWSLLLVIILGAWVLARLPGPPMKFHQWLLLGLGLAGLHIYWVLVLIGWFFAFHRRRSLSSDNMGWKFNMIQVLLVGTTFFGVAILLTAIQQGLLGTPNMYVMGSMSSSLAWYQERVTGLMPRAMVISAPALVFQLLMLAWSLWLAGSVIRWARWGWQCYSSGGIWYTSPRLDYPEPEPEINDNPVDDNIDVTLDENSENEKPIGLEKSNKDEK